MAIAVVGGLIVSTFLSLVFVPSFYTIMDDASVGRLWRWVMRPNEADEPDAAAERGATLHALPRPSRGLPVAAE